MLSQLFQLPFRNVFPPPMAIFKGRLSLWPVGMMLVWLYWQSAKNWCHPFSPPFLTPAPHSLFIVKDYLTPPVSPTFTSFQLWPVLCPIIKCFPVYTVLCRCALPSRLFLAKVMVITNAATCNLLAFMIVGNQCNRPGEAEIKNKCSSVCEACVSISLANLWCHSMVRLHRRQIVSPLSGKQNGCAITATFRRSARCPSIRSRCTTLALVVVRSDSAEVDFS